MRRLPPPIPAGNLKIRRLPPPLPGGDPRRRRDTPDAKNQRWDRQRSNRRGLQSAPAGAAGLDRQGFADKDGRDGQRGARQGQPNKRADFSIAPPTSAQLGLVAQ